MELWGIKSHKNVPMHTIKYLSDFIHAKRNKRMKRVDAWIKQPRVIALYASQSPYHLALCVFLLSGAGEGMILIGQKNMDY